MTLPGFDFCTAEGLLAALGDIHRFPSADKVAPYLGLVPSTYQSANRCYHGRITKQGRAHARWLLVEAAQAAAKHPGPLGAFFRKIARKKNRNVAIVATAHKLATLVWHLLINNEPYRYAQPQTLEAKLSRLRIRATGEKRGGGLAKGQPRSPQYGQGRSRAIPSLDALYEREGLPPIQSFKDGEHRMLTDQGLDQHVRLIRTARRVPKASLKP
jgi:transposase